MPVSDLVVASAVLGLIRLEWSTDVLADHKIVRRRYLGSGYWDQAVELSGPTVGPGPAVFNNQSPTSAPGTGARYSYQVQQRVPPTTGAWASSGPTIEAQILSTQTSPGTEIGQEAVRDAVRSWAQEAIGSLGKVIDEPANSPRPDKPYVSIALLGPSKVGGLDEVRVEEDQVLQCGLRRWGVRATAYGKRAHEIIASLMTATEMPVPCAHLEAAGLSIADVGQPTDLSDLLGDKREERVLFEFGVYAPNNASILPAFPEESIETLAATGVLGDNEVNVNAPPQ